MEFISLVWNELLLRPMLNSLVLLYTVLFHNFGLSIVVFTVIIRLVTLPLTLKQLRQTKAMSELQPRLQELQKRYGKDRQRLSQETMRLYREHGINPIGCLGPMLIQLPIWIALYQALYQSLPATPEALVGLSQRLYPALGLLHRVIPLNSRFLWLDLALPDPTPVLPVLVGVSMWVQQKMTTTPSADPRQQQTNQMMLWMMPLMFAFFTLQFPSGLALYWVVSNIIGIVIQYFVTGWGNLLPQRAPAGEPIASQSSAKETPSDAEQPQGQRGGLRQDGGRGRRGGPKRTRRRTR